MKSDPGDYQLNKQDAIFLTLRWSYILRSLKTNKPSLEKGSPMLVDKKRGMDKPNEKTQVYQMAS